MFVNFPYQLRTAREIAAHVAERVRHEGLAYYAGVFAGESAGVALCLVERFLDGAVPAFDLWAEVDEDTREERRRRGSSDDNCRTSRSDGSRRTSTNDETRRDTLTPCCSRPVTPPGRPPCIMWNPDNGVVQCHRCGAIYVPDAHGGYDVWVEAGGGTR